MRCIRRLAAVTAGVLAATPLAMATALAAPATPPAGDTGTSAAFAAYPGEITAADASGGADLDVTTSDFTLGRRGTVVVGFLMSAADGSALDPGLVEISGPGATDVDGPARTDVAGGTASLLVAELAPGAYHVTTHAENGTTGGYVLQAFLAGDANADFQVDAPDLAAVQAAQGSKLGDAAYDPLLDVNRNGVVNGGDSGWAGRNVGAATSLRLEDEPFNPIDVSLPDGALTLSGVDPSTVSSRRPTLTYDLTDTTFGTVPGDISLTVNGQPVPDSELTVTPNRIVATPALDDGRNDIFLQAYDEIGRPMFDSTTVWAGSYQLQVALRDEAGQPVTDPVTVRMSLTDDPSVAVTTVTSTGVATFPTVPARTVLVEAKTADNRFGSAGIVGWQGSETVTLRGFGTPSPVANNDFSLGTAGWDVGTAPVAIVTHVEDVGGSGVQAASAQDAMTPLSAPQPAERDRTAADAEQSIRQLAGASSGAPSGEMSAALVTDNDLAVFTSGEGPQSVSRTFVTDPGTTSVELRYRFVTTEVPGGWYGSQFNDDYSVALRTQSGGGAVSDTNSMNALGLASFDGSGSTAWRDATIDVNSDGDAIQVDAMVANVADGLLDSAVVVDFVREVKDEVTPALAWNTSQGGLNLTYRVDNGSVSKDTPINVYWAKGPSYSARVGAPVFSFTVPKGTAQGSHGPVHIAGSQLHDDPSGITHLIAASSPTRVGSVPDVRLKYGPDANQAVVPARMTDILKDSLRSAGAPVGTVTSTVRNANQQAHAMFDNLVKPCCTLEDNRADQYKTYGAAGDRVIGLFVALTQGMNRDQIIAHAGSIIPAMEAKIWQEGPYNVSHHAGDPTKISVVDVAYSSFGSNGPLFKTAAAARVTKIINEPKNKCYHLELLL